MDKTIDMAREAGGRAQQNKNCDVEYLMSADALETFEALVRADEREIAIKDFKHRLATAIDAMPFGDTAASFAVYIRDFK